MSARRAAPRSSVLRDEVLAEEVHRFDLESGLTVLVHRRPGFCRKFAVVGADFGSVDAAYLDPETGARRVVPDGAAHFLEHKLFEQEDGDAFEIFSRQGASANAETSFRTTSYFFQCDLNLEANLRTLLRMVLVPRFSAAAVEKEREIIVQEIRMYEDNPDWRAFNALVRGLYAAHPVRNDITGTVESVRAIDHAALLRCHRAFYDPGNLCLVVSGDVEPREVAEIALAETLGRRTSGRVVRLRVRERRRVLSARVEERLPVMRGKLLVGYKDRAVPLAGEALRRRDLLTAVLLAMMFGAASPARNRLYEAGIIDDSFYASYAGEEDFGFVTFGIETDEPERAREALLSEIRRFGRTGTDNDEFGRAIHKITGHFVRGLDSQEGTAFLLLSAALRGLDPFLVPALLRRVTPEEVRARFAELFAPGGHCTSVVRA